MSSDAPVKIKIAMPTLESTIRRAAPVSASCSELVVLMDLWAMTGYQRMYAPPGPMFRRAFWDAARVASDEGWSWALADPPRIWQDATLEAMAACGVDPFAD